MSRLRLRAVGASQRMLRCAVSYAAVLALSGCAALEGSAPTQLQELPEGVVSPSDYTALEPASPLGNLSMSLDQVAMERSVAVQEVRAAQARLAAQGFERGPQVRPTGSVDLTGDNDASFGISLEQVIWDGGRTRTRMDAAQFRVASAALQAWDGRNEDVYEGLEAYVNMARFQARLRAYNSLGRTLEELTDLLDIRASGGVAGGGEALRMSVARQELQREVIADTAALRQARSDLRQLVPDDLQVAPLSDLTGAAASCRRTWPNSEPPTDALARMDVSRSRLAENLLRAQRFPRLVLGAGAAITNVASGITPGVNVELDASDMLGFESGRVIEAAALDSRAALVTYQVQLDDTRADLSRLEANYIEHRSSLEQLTALQDANEASVDLYRTQLDSGTISLVEGINLYDEVTNTELDIIDVHAAILLNCLQSAEIRGLLVPFIEPDDDA